VGEDGRAARTGGDRGQLGVARVDRVGRGAGIDVAVHLVAATGPVAVDRVAAGTAGDRVVAEAAGQRVRAGAAVDRVGAVAARELILAAQPAQRAARADLAR